MLSMLNMDLQGHNRISSEWKQDSVGPITLKLSQQVNIYPINLLSVLSGNAQICEDLKWRRKPKCL